MKNRIQWVLGNYNQRTGAADFLRECDNSPRDRVDQYMGSVQEIDASEILKELRRSIRNEKRS